MSIDITIKDAANEPVENIRRIVAALLVLAGDVPTPRIEVETAEGPGTQYQAHVHITPPDPRIGMTFNAAELAEAKHLGESQPVTAPAIPSAAEAFAQSTAVVVPLPTAPVATTAPISEAPASTPPAPPAAFVPSAPPAAPLTAPPAPTGEVDSMGLPWDERIHSSSKAFIGDGTWKLKRGVDKAFVESLRAEHRGAPAPQPVAATVPPPPPPAPTSAPSATAPVVAPSIPGTSPVPPAPPTATPTGERNWLNAVTRLTKGHAAGLFDQAVVLQGFGVTHPSFLLGKDDVIEQVHQALDQLEAAAS